MTKASAPTDRYATVAIVLHWLTAAAIVVQLGLAWRMQGPPTPEAFAVTQLHKSVGVTILILSLARLAWRLANPPPPMPAALKRWERLLARFTHAFFYVVLIGMPLTGWIMVSTARIEVPTFLYSLVPWPHVPGLAGLEGPARGAWNTVGFAGHLALAWGFILLLPLHVAGALKHQLFSRDEPVLGRMAPGAKPGRWAEPRLLVIALGVAAAAATGLLITPPRPAAPPPAAALGDPFADVAPMPAAGAPVWTVLPGGVINFTSAWDKASFTGSFERWRADVAFDPKALDSSRIRVLVDLSSAVTGDAQRDAGVQGADWFDVANHPIAEFTADRFEAFQDDVYLARGMLSLRGIRRPLDLPFRLHPDPDGKRTRATATLALDRRQFGVGQGKFTATDQVPAQVIITVLISAERANP